MGINGIGFEYLYGVEAAQNIKMMEQQILGWHSRDMGMVLEDLLLAAGLKKHEYAIMEHEKMLHYLSDNERKRIVRWLEQNGKAMKEPTYYEMFADIDGGKVLYVSRGMIDYSRCELVLEKGYVDDVAARSKLMYSVLSDEVDKAGGSIDGVSAADIQEVQADFERFTKLHLDAIDVETNFVQELENIYLKLIGGDNHDNIMADTETTKQAYNDYMRARTELNSEREKSAAKFEKITKMWGEIREQHTQPKET